MPTPSQAETEAKRVNEVTGEAEEAREAMEAEVPQRALAVDEPNGEGGDAATMKPAGSPASVIEVAGEAESIGGDEGELGRPGSAGEEIAKLTASAPTEVQKADAPEAVDVSDVVPGAGSEPVVGETEVAAVGEEVAPGSANVGGEATPQGEAVTEETSLDGTDAEAESGAESGAVRVEAEHDDAQTESVIDPPTDAGETEAGELGEPEVAEEPGKTEAEDAEAEAGEEGREAQEAVNEADGHREGTTEPDAEAAKREEEGGEEAEEAEGDKEAASEEVQKASADASEPAGAGSEEAPGEADGGATTEDSGAEPQPGAGGGAAPPPVAAPVESAPGGVELQGEGPEAEIAAPIEAAPEVGVGEGSEAEPERR